MGAEGAAMELPIAFPDCRAVAYHRAQEFQRLSADERWREIAAVLDLGWAMVVSSPRRAAIEQRWAEQEAEWRRIQTELFKRYAG
jgi:hypothetical protein